MADENKTNNEEQKGASAPDTQPGVPTPEAATVKPAAEETERAFTWVDSTGKSQELVIRRPTAEEIQASDWEYARVFNEAIAEGIMPRAALISMLKDRGINFEKEDQEITIMQSELDTLVGDLEEARKNQAKEKVSDLKDDIAALRQKVIERRTAVSDYTRSSAESLANEARDLFVLATVIEQNKEPYFKASNSSNLRLAMKERLKKINKTEYMTLKMQASFEFMTFANGLSSNFMEKFPEKQKETWD